jgi:hypothetical protein
MHDPKNTAGYGGMKDVQLLDGQTMLFILAMHAAWLDTKQEAVRMHRSSVCTATKVFDVEFGYRAPPSRPAPETLLEFMSIGRSPRCIVHACCQVERRPQSLCLGEGIRGPNAPAGAELRTRPELLMANIVLQESGVVNLSSGQHRWHC